MPHKNIAVFGIYPDRQRVEDTIDALQKAGFRNTDVSILFPDNKGSKDLALEKHTKAPEGAAAGAAGGAILGGALGWLTGLGAIAMPGAGAFIAAGPIMAVLAGMGAGGVVGGITGALIGMGVPEYEAKRYLGRLRKGGILLSVHSDNDEWVRRAKWVLKKTGAEDISTTGEAKADYAESDKPAPRGREGSETK